MAEGVVFDTLSPDKQRCTTDSAESVLVSKGGSFCVSAKAFAVTFQMMALPCLHQ